MPRYFENSTFVAAILENRHFDLVGLISRCPNFDFRIQDTFYHRNQLKNLIKYVCPDNAIFSPPLLAYYEMLLASMRIQDKLDYFYYIDHFDLDSSI